MRINADLQLKDVPGQLVRALMPIAEAGGNIVSIVHERSNVINGKIVVKVVFDVEDSVLPLILKRLRENDVDVMRIGEIRERKRTTLLVQGLKDFGALEGMSYLRLEGDCALVTFEADSDEELERFVSRVEASALIARSIE